VDTKCKILGTRGMLLQASLLLNSSNHKNTHTGMQEPETHPRNWLKVDKEINSHKFEIYTNPHRD
jgi:hypothetical protein